MTAEGGRITRIEPDRDHVTTRGYSCVKGLQQHTLYDSPDRLTTPLKRVGERFEPVSWDAALADIGARVRRLRRHHGADSIAMYLGTAGGFSLLHTFFGAGFMQGLGSRSTYSPATQDCANKFAVARHVYGFPFTQPIPDLDHTRCLVVVGANPAVSKWSFLQVPHAMKRLAAIETRGGRLFFVDPRRTESTRAGGTHLFIRPGTDVFFYLSFLHEVVARGGVRRQRVARHMTGLEPLEELAAAWPPERTAPVTGIAPGALRALVQAYLAAGGAALYCSTGVNMGPHGALAFWLQEAINAVTGNLDRRGGTLVPRGVVDFPRLGRRAGLLMRDDRSRVGDLPSVNDCFPGGVLADEILTPGAGQLRALFCTGGNPLITMAGAARLREALARLDLLVVVDLFLNETASLAHYVLPAVSPFQRPDIPFIFPTLLGMQLDPYQQATRAVVPPAGEQRDEMWIYLELAHACGVSMFGSAAAQRLLRGGRRLGLSQERVLSLLLRATGHGSFARLLREPHGRRLPHHVPGTFLGQRVYTADGRLQLAPPELLRAAAGLEAAFAAEQAARGELRLITRRAVRTHNSWTHNAEPYLAGDRTTNHLYIHPDDAARAGLREGALADVRSATGTVRVPVALTGDLMPGAVALPHGWGHQHARGLSVASRTTGVNVNLLAADGPRHLDPLSGMAHLTGIPVRVTPAAGPLDPGSWSGIGAAAAPRPATAGARGRG